MGGTNRLQPPNFVMFSPAKFSGSGLEAEEASWAADLISSH